ncbi:hypothetical protein LFL96_34700 (plasmid) [Paraburkholderia sp. D15]|uniref:hypothetical protein n=1 Tax=Paraburkholderia sp. D15 TaxID=2880218 RepID=UPI00247A81A4|nr:hypothetical protein [Paraburkholderia sp. D15]WGS55103.1 hypothetical protein LFL96_34700 [Paraburkholderia sp. D15]
MDDFDYVVRDSNAAWLDGRGDGRFERYESFYQDSRAKQADEFDLEKTNEAFAKVAGRSPSRLFALASSPNFARLAIALLAVFITSRTVPLVAVKLPYATACMLAGALVALRIFHRRKRNRK